jgi:hypothetical protein
MTGHCDADCLAEFRAGLMPGRRRRAIAAHLRGCEQCAALDERLAQVSALLAAAPMPAMPDSVTRRLDAVLAAEAEAYIHAERSEVKSAEPGVVRIRPLRSARWLAPATAAAAIVLAAAGFGLSQLSSGSSGAPSAAPAGAAGTALGQSAGHASPHQADLQGPVSGAGPAERLLSIVPSSIDYQPATLRQQLQSQLDQRGELRTIPATTSLAACVKQVAGGSTPVLVESARYRGAPATIVVVPHGGGYLGKVAGPDCSATNSDILASTVLSPGISTP